MTPVNKSRPCLIRLPFPSRGKREDAFTMCLTLFLNVFVPESQLRTLHCIYSFFLPENPGRTPAQTSGQKPGPTSAGEFNDRVKILGEKDNQNTQSSYLFVLISNSCLLVVCSRPGRTAYKSFCPTRTASCIFSC